jgi:hypothetical protein
MADDDGKKKFTMTVTSETEDWLDSTYPDADNIQEALRMAVSDARLVRAGGDSNF